MTFLSRARKEDLIKLAEELTVDVPPAAKIIEIIKCITSCKEYNEEVTKNLLETIVSERLEKERLANEKERLAQEIQLEKLKSDNLNKQNGTHVTTTDTFKSSDLSKLIKSFDANETDISTYLLLFERQATRINIDKKEFVTYLMGLLPLSIVQIIAQEPEESTSNYDYVKTLLLKRFKLSPEQFRQKFIYHKKEQNVSWRDFAYELQHYFEEWITGIKIADFKSLKELMIVDQLKRKLPSEIRDHFIDDLHKIIELKPFIEQLETYETARIRVNKSDNKFKKNYLPPKQNKDLSASSQAPAFNINASCFY
ncbi:uncharacterized protein, partial [Parasteatoda tepidariorum]|uniref:uncharacterized protein n=1 Tax=Parasteatoda tepidariorum TaxID=114398 RepID=UPI0039BCA8E1